MPNDPPPDDPAAPAPRAPADADDAPAGSYGERFGERPIPRGCNPLVFGLVMGTIQFAVTVYFMRSC